MKIRIMSFGLPAALLAASLFGACSNTAKGVEEDTKENAAKAQAAAADASAATEKAAQDAKVGAEHATEAAKDATADLAQDVKTGADKAADASKDAANKTANTLDGAQQTMQIKTALIAEKSVDASHVDVDTDGNMKVVTLKGSVPTAAQKATAARIAQDKAPGYKVVNDLVVKP